MKFCARVCVTFRSCSTGGAPAGRFDLRQMSLDRISSVRKIPGGLDAAEFLAITQAGKVAIEVDHPTLRAHSAISGGTAEALARDLSE